MAKQEAERDELREMRECGHESGIRGSSKMTEDELREALHKVERGEDPTGAKREAKGWE